MEQSGKLHHPGAMESLFHSVSRPLLPLVAAVSLGFSPLHAEGMPAPQDREAASFALCTGLARVTCVVDGDTFWYRGLKIRIADINAPELGHPSCASEARLAEAATRRLTDLLNAGPFTLAVEGREIDRYGRALRVVLRGGRSLGGVLEREGLDEHWHGHRGDWCAA
jgi:endonuclease YncB( thermonuclease family)